MIAPDSPDILPRFQELKRRIQAQGVDSWLNPDKTTPDREGLLYLCKFAFFTGIVTKAEIARILELDRQERKELVKSWYDEHRERGCGTC